MRFLTCSRHSLLLVMLFAGCQRPSSSTLRVDEPREVAAASSDALELTGLLKQYDSLPPHEKNGLPGDKVVMQMEIFLTRLPPEQQVRAQPIIREHNARMVKRALHDPDLEEITGTEFAPPPRER